MVSPVAFVCVQLVFEPFPRPVSERIPLEFMPAIRQTKSPPRVKDGKWLGSNPKTITNNCSFPLMLAALAIHAFMLQKIIVAFEALILQHKDYIIETVPLIVQVPTHDLFELIDDSF